METQNIKFEIIRQKEASELVELIEDDITKKMIISANHFIITSFLTNSDALQSDIDIKFIDEALIRMFSQHDFMRDILNDSKEDWFDEFEKV